MNQPQHPSKIQDFINLGSAQTKRRLGGHRNITSSEMQQFNDKSSLTSAKDSKQKKFNPLMKPPILRNITPIRRRRSEVKTLPRHKIQKERSERNHYKQPIQVPFCKCGLSGCRAFQGMPRVERKRRSELYRSGSVQDRVDMIQKRIIYRPSEYHGKKVEPEAISANRVTFHIRRWNGGQGNDLYCCPRGLAWLWEVGLDRHLLGLIRLVVASECRDEERCIVKLKARGRTQASGEWQKFVEKFFLQRYQWTRVKYGKLSEKLFCSDPESGKQLKWKKVYEDFCKYLQQHTNNSVEIPHRDTFRKYVRSEYHIGFKIPRSDQCNDCALFDIMINQEQNPEKKKLLKTLKNEHLADAEICQDAVHWAFQKSYKQLGRPYDDWNELEIQDIIS